MGEKSLRKNKCHQLYCILNFLVERLDVIIQCLNLNLQIGAEPFSIVDGCVKVRYVLLADFDGVLNLVKLGLAPILLLIMLSLLILQLRGELVNELRSTRVSLPLR